MRVRVDRERCVGSGLCVMTAPTVFDQSADGLVALRGNDLDADNQELVEQAEEICPARAIWIAPR
jgi:ferredoxin